MLTACTSSGISENTTTDENTTIPNPETSCSRSECWRFANFQLPVQTIGIGDGKAKDVYHRDDDIVEIEYDIKQKEEAKNKCLDEVIELADIKIYDEDEYYADARTYGCKNFIYWPAIIHIKTLDRRLDLSHKNMQIVGIRRYSWWYSYKLIVDRCEWTQDDRYDAVSWSYWQKETEKIKRYLWYSITNCSLAYPVPMWGRDKMLVVAKWEYLWTEYWNTEWLCKNAENLNLVGDGHLSCKNHPDSICGTMKWNICYTELVSEYKWDDVNPYSIMIYKWYTAILSWWYSLWTNNTLIGERLIKNQ